MSAAPESIVCPFCRTEMPLAALLVDDEVRAAYITLATQCVPLGPLVMQYVTLFTPPKTRLTQRKQTALLCQLLPDMKRQVITHKGLDLQAPLSAWAQAMEQMLNARAAGRLDLPLSGHGYLYAILAGLAEKNADQAERQREQDRRLSPQRDTVQVRGQTMEIGTALEVVYGNKDPALADIDQRDRNAAPMPSATRERFAAIKKGQP